MYTDAERKWVGWSHGPKYLFTDHEAVSAVFSKRMVNASKVYTLSPFSIMDEIRNYPVYENVTHHLFISCKGFPRLIDHLRKLRPDLDLINMDGE